jgi:uncharacterized membrane protein YfcA
VSRQATSIVVLTALPARLVAVPWSALVPHWSVALNLLAGSLAGAWVGASWATRMRSGTLYRTLALLLVVIAAGLLATHLGAFPTLHLASALLVVAGVLAGFAIGVVASLMGVAGGELIIPTIVLLFGTDIKVAGSLSLAVSLPTMLVAFARYSRDQSFVVLRRNARFAVVMTLGSIVGTLLGGLLLGIVPGVVLIPALVVLLLLQPCQGLAALAEPARLAHSVVGGMAAVRCEAG